MRFEESIHWPEGLFLMPHHMQQLQASMELRDRRDRTLHLPYPTGLIDFELDAEALENLRVVVKRISAVLPSGAEVSMPGNASVPALDLTGTLGTHRDPFLVYLALPLRSEHDANLAEDAGSLEKRLFVLHETTVRDENTGDNEIPLVRHRAHARLVTEFESRIDMEALPILRLIPVYAESTLPKLRLDASYIPPFLLLGADCPLLAMATELDIQLQRRRDHLLRRISDTKYSSDAPSGGALFDILQLQTLNRCGGRLHLLLTSGRLTPFELFVELHTMLGELTALHPMREIMPVARYDHLDYAGQFTGIMRQIRLMIMDEGLAGYRRIEFAATPSGRGLGVGLRPEDFDSADGWYLAIRCSGDPRRIVEAVESGDTFKMVNPGGADLRVRGVRLTELRYPPRFLPAMSEALWFNVRTGESPRIWDLIRKEAGIVLDWGDGLFPDLEATLFITTLKQGGDR